MFIVNLWGAVADDDRVFKTIRSMWVSASGGKKSIVLQTKGWCRNPPTQKRQNGRDSEREIMLLVVQSPRPPPGDAGALRPERIPESSRQVCRAERRPRLSGPLFSHHKKRIEKKAARCSRRVNRKCGLYVIIPSPPPALVPAKLALKKETGSSCRA